MFQVNLAAQVCSHSVYAGMQTLVALGKLESSAAETSQFLKEVNDVFDLLNIRNLKGKNMCMDIQKIQQVKESVKLWHLKVKGTKPPCFGAMSQSLNALECMIQDLVHNGAFKFLLTGRINQDCLENFFSQVRGKGGHRFNPSAVEFAFAYRSLSATMLLCPVPRANCKSDDDQLLVSLSTMSGKAQKESRKRKRVENENENEDENPVKVCKVIVQNIEDFEVSSTVANVVSYVAGYILKKLQISSKCSSCFQSLCTKDYQVVLETDLLCHFKAYKHKAGSAYGALIAPSQSFLNLLERVECIFQRNIQQLLCKKGILVDLMQLSHKHVPYNFLQLCDIHKDMESMQTMFEKVVKLYLVCRLHYYCKFESRKLQITKFKQNRKAHILMHK